VGDVSEVLDRADEVGRAELEVERGRGEGVRGRGLPDLLVSREVDGYWKQKGMEVER
jgi:hypothetical protein